jgi:hypothetical protein
MSFRHASNAFPIPDELRCGLPAAALAAALSDHPARPCVTSSRARAVSVVQYGREIAVAKDHPTVENMTWADRVTLWWER